MTEPPKADIHSRHDEDEDGGAAFVLQSKGK